MSIEKRQNGWRVRWRDEQGRNRSKGGFRTKAEANQWDAERRRRVRMGSMAEAEPSAERLDLYLERWFERESEVWAASTAEGYRYLMNKWIIPFAGGTSLRDLGTKNIREWRSAIMKNGASRDQANKALSVLSSALGSAVLDEHLPSNPALKIEGLKHQRSERGALEVAQVEAMRRRLEGRPNDQAMLTLLFYCGLRPSEAHAVRSEDVKGTELSVTRAWVSGEIKPVKTYEARTVALCKPVARELGQFRRPGLICPNRWGQPMNPGNWRNRNFNLAKSGIADEATPYWGRHTFASLLIWQGEPPQYVAAQMGDRLETVLEHYTHIFDRARNAPSVPMEDQIMEARA